MLPEDLQKFIEEDPSRIKLLEIESIGMANDGVGICNVSLASSEEDAVPHGWVGGHIRQDDLDDVLKPFLQKKIMTR